VDLNQFSTREKSHEGIDVALVINGETVYGDDEQPVTFRLKGVSDPEVQRVVLQTSKAPSRTPEEVLAADLKLARAAVVGWSDNWTLDGEKVPFSRSAIEKVFAEPVLRRAVLSATYDSSRFMKGA